MNKNPSLRAATVALACLLSACAGNPIQSPEKIAMVQPQRVTEHRGSDDLLTAGLGLDGLRGMAPPTFADPAHPTAAETRRWLIDKSALVRLSESPDASDWRARIDRGLVRIATGTILEIGYSARSADDLHAQRSRPPVSA